MHHCVLESGKIGLCRARVNRDGVITAENYGIVTALALDPIEKKPLKQFFPGTKILSAGSYGCNLSCPFCQNHGLSMSDREGLQWAEFSPKALAEKAQALESHGNIGIAFTYNEPLVGFEFVRDTAKAVKEAGMKTVAVTNGSVTKSVADQVLPYLDALNIDLKGFTETYYKFLGGDLETVKSFILQASKTCHVELTTLIVPGKNDSEEEMERLAAWIAQINPEIPLHVTRFFPRWKMTEAFPTELDNILRLTDIAEKHLRYVFKGNC